MLETMSILMSVMQLIIVPIQGVSQGVQPIISYNFGAGKRDRVMGAFKRMLIICLAASMTLGISAIVGPEFFARMFTDKKRTCGSDSKCHAGIFLWNYDFWDPDGMSVRVYRTGAGKVITVCGTFEKGDFARAIGNHSPEIFRSVRNLLCRTNCGYYCSICDECLIFDDHKKVFA